MSDIGPGDVVVCVERPEEHNVYPWVFPPALGSKWIVRSVGYDSGGFGIAALSLIGDGLPLRSPDFPELIPGWPLACFAKTNGPGGIEEDADEDAPIRVKEDA